MKNEDENKEILKVGDRNGVPIALIKMNKTGLNEFLIAFGYKISDNKLEWDYSYYFDQDYNKACRDFNKVINGGNIADTFSDKKHDNNLENSPESNLIINAEEKNIYAFDYMLLDRLFLDCKYYLGNGNRQEKHLWAKNTKDQITEMKKIYNSFPQDMKPEWINLDIIDDLEKRMCNVSTLKPKSVKEQER